MPLLVSLLVMKLLAENIKRQVTLIVVELETPCLVINLIFSPTYLQFV